MHHSVPDSHAQHDLDLIAGHAAGDLSNNDRDRADALMEACSTCAELRGDLVAIAAATRALPRHASAPRDFRLDAAQAARLGRGGLVHRLAGWLAAPGSLVRPLAMSLTSLGVAGLLVATVLPSLFGSAGAAAPQQDLRAGGVTSIAASQAPAAQPVPAQPGATAVPEFGAAGAPGASAGDDAKSNLYATGATPPADARGPVAGVPGRERADAAAGVNLPLVGSALLLLLGVALFVLRFAAGRHR